MPAPRSLSLLIVFALTTFVSAFLLFFIQPLISKIILPWFGGGTGVWATCIVFFQVMLCGGYAYAHATQRWLTPKQQTITHLALLAAGVLMLPIMPAVAWKPEDGNYPAGRILLLLLRHVGVPYLGLAATGPLLQAWYARCFPGHRTYRLYALSNVGSLASLLLFPFWFEQVMGMSLLSTLWSWGFAAFAVLCGYVSVMQLFRSQAAATPVVETPPYARGAVVPVQLTPEQRTALAETAKPDPTWRDYALWIALPALGSMMLVAGTNHLCQDIASIPLLWILPLSLYLLSFIICFDAERWYIRPLFAIIGLFGLYFSAAMVFLDFHPELGSGLIARAAMPVLRPAYEHFEALKPLPPAEQNWSAWFENQTLIRTLPINFRGQVLAHLVGLFGLFMVCHGELTRYKPATKHLTAFFLAIAVGGALGGTFVSLVSPFAFDLNVEWMLGLCISILLICGLLLDYQEGYKYLPRYLFLVVPAILLGLMVLWQNSQLPQSVAELTVGNQVDPLYPPGLNDKDKGLKQPDSTQLLSPMVALPLAAGLVVLLGSGAAALYRGLQKREELRFWIVNGAMLLVVCLAISDALNFLHVFQAFSEWKKLANNSPDAVNAVPDKQTADDIPRAGQNSPVKKPAAKALTQEQIDLNTERYAWRGRNFYGAMVVKDTVYPNSSQGNYRELRHGRITHGTQYLHGLKNNKPTTYYTPDSGVGRAITYFDREKTREIEAAAQLPADQRPKSPITLRVGSVGLGTGSLAAYAVQDKPEAAPAISTAPAPLPVLKKDFAIYEINPLVCELSEKPIAELNPRDENSTRRKLPYFTYVHNARNSGANVELVLGDARLMMEREANEGKLRGFDVLSIDAFSGDSIPTHLLTKEALEIYLKQLQPEGILAIHISNRYLDLEPICKALAELGQLQARVVEVGKGSSEVGAYSSTWVLLTKNRKFLTDLDQDVSSNLRSLNDKEPLLWTDDFTSLMQILK